MVLYQKTFGRALISRCTDRSAGGCADWHTSSTIRARATVVGWTPRRHRLGGAHNGAAVDDGGVGLVARSTARPCRLSAVPAGPLTAARPGVPGKPLGREPRPLATALRQRLAAPARAATCHCLGRPGPSRHRRGVTS